MDGAPGRRHCIGGRRLSGDRDNFYREEPVGKARKAHVCTICRREIPAGASYVRVSKASCGERTSHAAHDDCLAAAIETPRVAPFRAESRPATAEDFLPHD